MLKRLGVVIPSTILTLLMAVGLSTPAFAYVDATAVAEEPTQVIEEAEPTEEENPVHHRRQRRGGGQHRR